ncbi:MAG: hypothetical protein HY692_05715, partial [Cyanobacteria bacterium NC_groundwater_1444_Ag_S-0.65um_54_12]|nr:hypothetical protein [Cyanobacteria bacterium NC_groundwater_1444_Ag_S-0.65um_54_12]
RTGEHLLVAGAEVVCRMMLPRFMLFGDRYSAIIPPSEQMRPFGERVMFLYSSEPLLAEQLTTTAYHAALVGTHGAYAIWKLQWRSPEEPFCLTMGEGLTWNFEQPCDRQLEFSSKATRDPFLRLPVGLECMFRSWDDISLDIKPALSAGEDRKIQLALYANDILVAERSVEATSRLAGLRAGNASFTGAQLRRGFGLGDTASGHYRLALRQHNFTFSEFIFTVLPPLDVTDLPMVPYVEGEEASFLLVSKVRCFQDDTNRRRVIFGSVQVPNQQLGIGEFVPPEVTQQVPLDRPRLSIMATFEPPVCGWRLYEDTPAVEDYSSQFIKKTAISRDDMAKYGLVIFSSQARNGAIMINDQIVKQLEFYEGYAFCELADLIARVSGRASKIVPLVGDRKLATLTVTWTPRVFQFERVAEYIADNAVRFSMAYEGPQGDPVRLVVKDPDGRTLAREEFSCEGRMERREGMEIRVREDLSAMPFVTLHGSLPSIAADHEFGTLDFFNQERDLEMKKVIERMEKDPHNPEVYWLRAELYRNKGLLDLSVRDYEQALVLGLRDTGKRKRAQETIARQDWLLMQQEIQILANFFIPFCRKELHLEY